MRVEIKNRDGDVLYRSERADSVRGAVEEAIAKGTNLAGAYLAGTNLAGANLEGTNFARANLAGTYLVGAYLADADLARANLAGAYLARANLEGAYLVGAYLADADLARAKGVADWLTPYRDDLWSVLDLAPHEVPGLIAAIVEGRVDGSVYTGECACLLGTIANVRGCSVDRLGIEKDSSRPAEVWFMSLKPGHKSSNSQNVAIALGWICEWQVNRLRAGRTIDEPVPLPPKKRAAKKVAKKARAK